MEEKQKLLSDLYYNPKIGLISAKSLYDLVKNVGITFKEVKTLLMSKNCIKIINQ